MRYAIIICLALAGLALRPKQEAPSVAGSYTKRSPYTVESMSLHPDSTYRYSFHGCMSSLIDSGTYSYHHGLIRLSSVYEGLKDTLPFNCMIRSWHKQELWLSGDKVFYKKTGNGYDLSSFWVRSNETYRYAFNKKSQTIQAGIIKNRQLISGLEYIYDAHDSLGEVRFIENGKMVKDSLLQ